jgi:hypothetical protein
MVQGKEERRGYNGKSVTTRNRKRGKNNSGQENN